MKIVLIYPYCLEERTQDDDVRPVPIGVYYIGALLREHNYSVEILNWYDINKTPKRIKKILSKIKPDIIGFSILHANRWGGIEIAQIAKKLNPKVKIVFGGIGPTFLWRHLLTKFKVIDFAVIGEGEFAFLHLVQCLEKKAYDRLDAIKGIVFRRGPDLVKTQDAEPLVDIDQLPNPAKYFQYQHVILSRGCPWNCTFCGSPQFWSRKVRFHSPTYFVDQLELLSHKGTTFFYFSDDTFTLKPDLVIDICKRILQKELNITWSAISRVNLIHEDILYWMRKAGCIQISYGVESGSKKIRDFLNKDIRVDDIKKAFDLTKKYGILPRAYFIYGSPGESHATIQESINLMHEIKPLDMVSYILDIYPGTALYAEYQKKTGNTDDIWQRRIEDIMYFETDPDLSADMVMDFGKKLRSAFYDNLPRYAEDIELVDRQDLFALHSDFCSRLGMTFSHGGFSRFIPADRKEKIAARLFSQALQYHPDHRAFLGLGIIYQKNLDVEKSIRILTEGIDHFPESEPMHLCMGINFMNLGRYREALSYLGKFQKSREARQYIEICNRQLGSS